jgi:hypothetical protein
MQSDSKSRLLAQAFGTTGTELTTASLPAAIQITKHKDNSLLTDSLWGNLILEMAYERDKELSGLLRRVNLLNFTTLGCISGIAGGTLAQGITALYVLNPQPGHEDSYVPGALGVALSAATICTFGARLYFGHRFQKHIHDRQMALKKEVMDVLDQVEGSDGTSTEAVAHLETLVGKRASKEWLQMWRSSHQFAVASKAGNARVSTAGVVH